MTKRELIERLEKVNELDQVEGFKRAAVVKNWVVEGKSRTYLALEETRENSKHYVKKDCGYYDNINDVYVAGKVDLSATRAYGLSGAKVEF